jgi:hypothetical protein
MTGNKRRWPVGLHTRVQRVIGKINQERQHGQNDQGGDHILFQKAAEQTGGAKRCQKRDQRIEQTDKRADKLEDVLGGIPITAGPPELFVEADPVVQMVPVEHRRERQDRNQSTGPELPGQQPAAGVRNPQEPQDDPRPEEQDRVFRQQPAPGHQTDHQPPVCVFGSDKLGQRPKTKSPEQDRRGIRCCKDPADTDQQAGVQEQDCPTGDARIKQDKCRPPKCQRSDQAGKDDQSPNRKHGVSKNGLSRCNPPADHRRVIIVAQSAG